MNMNPQCCDNRWNEYNKQLDLVSIEGMDFLSHPIIQKTITSPIEKNSKYCNIKINKILENFKIDSNTSCIEIGAGYGNFCKILNERTNFKEYTIVDSSSMLRFSKRFLMEHSIQDKCNFVDSETISELCHIKYNIFFSFICLTELPCEYRSFIFTNILKYCEKVFIIDSLNESDFKTELIDNLNTNFKKFKIQEFNGFWKNHGCYIGEK